MIVRRYWIPVTVMIFGWWLVLLATLVDNLHWVHLLLILFLAELQIVPWIWLGSMAVKAERAGRNGNEKGGSVWGSNTDYAKGRYRKQRR